MEPVFLIRELILNYDRVPMDKVAQILQFLDVQIYSLNDHSAEFKVGINVQNAAKVTLRKSSFKTDMARCTCQNFFRHKFCEHLSAVYLFCMGEGREHVSRFIQDEAALDGKNLALPIDPSVVENAKRLNQLLASFIESAKKFKVLYDGTKKAYEFAFTNAYEDDKTYVQKQDGHINLSCSCVDNDIVFCKHIFTALQYLQNHKIFRECLLDDQVRERYQDVLQKEAGIDDATLDEMFFFGFAHGEPKLIIQGAANPYSDLIGKNLNRALQDSFEGNQSEDFKKAIRVLSIEVDKEVEFVLWDTKRYAAQLYRAPYLKTQKTISASFTKLESYNIKDNWLMNFYIGQQRLVTLLKEEDILNKMLFQNHKENRKTLAAYSNFIWKPTSASDAFEPKKKDVYPIQISRQTLSLKIAIKPADIDFFWANMQLILVIGENELAAEDFDIYPMFAVFKDVAYFYNSSSIAHFLINMEHSVNFMKKDLPELYQTIDALAPHFELVIDKEIVPNFEKNSIPIEKKLFLTEEGNRIFLRPVVEYAKVGDIDILSPVPTQQFDGEKFVSYFRNKDVEIKFDRFIRQHIPSLEMYGEFNQYAFTTGSEVSIQWFMDFYALCKEEEIVVYGIEDLKSFNYNPNKPEASFTIKSGIDWFDLDVTLRFGDQEASVAQILQAFENKEKFVRLDDGTLGLLPESWVKNLNAILKSSQIHDQQLQISKTHFNLIYEYLLENEPDDTQLLDELAEKVNALRNFDKIEETELPENLKADLRPYQIQGYNWLKFLQKYGFGGCLADDMGLGKTLQVISVLANQPEQQQSLLVLPLSIVYNWTMEIDKFCPGLTYYVHHGPTRSTSNWGKAQIILTTYGTMVNDIVALSKKHFYYVVLDESQAIKNPSSKRYKAARLLKGAHKLALTGTPIENNTFDLYAQMNFANPGLLGSINSFQQKFSNRIDLQGDQRAATDLKKIIHPFILRRSKETVAKDLPEKTETVVYCKMDEPQRQAYDEYKELIIRELKNNIDQKGFNNSKLFVLDALLKLRQMCIHPKLVSKDAVGSIKFDMLFEQLRAIIPNHKVLIFSQFVEVLKLLKTEMDAQKIKYFYLDGQTKNRMDLVESFQTSKNTHTFLISLKAGGTGLNLTAADYVFIVDPWWNPAVEAQAIDRSHRIGQDKHVFAYKFICRDTIEEKILKLQKHKKELSQQLIQADPNIMKSLTKEELMEIFE